VNQQIVNSVFSVYEILKDSIKVTRRSINKDLNELHNQTVFFGEQRDNMLKKMSAVEIDLDDIMVLSLFASFERELRFSIKEIIDKNTIKINPTLIKLTTKTTDSIERWTVIDMVDALSDVVSEEMRGKVKQIYEYRNWVAHGKNTYKLPSTKTDPKTVQITLSDFILQASSAI